VIAIEAKKLKKKLDEAHIKMRAKQDNTSSSNLFAKNFADDNNKDNIEKSTFYRTGSVMRTQQISTSGFKTSTSFFESSHVKSFVDKLKKEVRSLINN